MRQQMTQRSWLLERRKGQCAIENRATRHAGCTHLKFDKMTVRVCRGILSQRAEDRVLARER